MFVLGGVIIDRAYARNIIAPAMQAFKIKHFGSGDVILHTVEMGKGQGVYSFLADPVKRTSFYADLNTMLDRLVYKVVACVIKKPELVKEYGANAVDPYHYSLEILVERFCLELGAQADSGFICAEQRNPGLDKALIEAWEEVRTNSIGTGYTSSKSIDEQIIGLDLKNKKLNLAGMQLADLVITPIGRHVVGMQAKTNEVQWTIVEKKLRRVGAEYMGKGLIIKP